MAPSTEGCYSNLNGLVSVSERGVRLAKELEVAHGSNRTACLSINTPPRPLPKDGRYGKLRTGLQSTPEYEV